jgi:signal transduction histidine kinase/DNA-binding NarL/FixJ family response regulator
MKTLLVLSQSPDLPGAVRAALDPEQYRVLHRPTLEEAEPFLAHGLADVCVLDVELTDVQSVWLLEKVRRRAPNCPTIIYTGAKPTDWEEEAYIRGAAHVLTKPVRARMLNTLVERLWTAETSSRQVAIAPLSPGREPTSRTEAMTAAPREIGAAQSLGILREFSGVLTHSLNAEAMLNEVMALLREILSINRAAIFLRQPLSSLGATALNEESRRLRAACSVGLSTGLLQHFELSLEAGIGGQLVQLGHIIRRYGDEVRNDVETQKEFELLGSQVAVPILDRDNLIGVAVFDGRITGEPLTNSELELIFHLLEQVALAIKNIWLHNQLSANHQMMVEILRELSSACVVVSRDLAVLHANKAARKYFSRAERRSGDLEFSDLPQVLGTRVYQVLRTGTAISTFRYEPENSPGTAYNVNIVPFQAQASGLPASALLMVEDLTQSEQLRRLEVEASNLRLVRSMADRLTHEIGNALVPLSVHQQMLSEKLGRKNVDQEFLKLMERDLGDSVKRVTRFTNQMRFLARESQVVQETFPLAPLLEEAYEEARKYQPAKAGQLKYEEPTSPTVITGDRAALKHAFAEVMLNALQANPGDPKVGVRLQAESGGNGRQGLQIEVQDNGGGFTPEAAQKAAVPFFTTRNVGLGLGLTVTRRIIETHHGKLEILPPAAGKHGLVRISLPTGAAEPEPK